jgi:hypothetical protein
MGVSVSPGADKLSQVHEGIFDWFPRDLAHVALRLARADELQEQLGRECLDWSANALELKQLRRPDGLLDVVLERVRPIPPVVEMLLSEIVNHLQASIDNVVFYITETVRGVSTAPQPA